MLFMQINIRVMSLQDGSNTNPEKRSFQRAVFTMPEKLSEGDLRCCDRMDCVGLDYIGWASLSCNGALVGTYLEHPTAQFSREIVVTADYLLLYHQLLC